MKCWSLVTVSLEDNWNDSDFFFLNFSNNPNEFIVKEKFEKENQTK